MDKDERRTARLIRAVSSPRRVALLDLLRTTNRTSEGQSLSELALRLSITVSTARRHIAILRCAGLINSKKTDGQILIALDMNAFEATSEITELSFLTHNHTRIA